MATDDPKHAIIEWLSDPPESLAKMKREQGVLAEAATIQFLKVKSRGQLHLHAVQYESTTKQQWDETCYVERDTAGFWHVKGSLRTKRENRYMVTEEDRKKYPSQPWVKLSGSEGSRCFFLLGYIIDNGFDVTRVRLIASTGQVEEDSVQDGLVLFLIDHPFPLPLEVELYNHSNTLIGRQMS
ncbi:MAG TPA: hypothetical protein VJ761_02595 [Ktedonobacteraceae bacterium]|nr:hypothetical protein [Ktedonobacteraceae bacterium]